MPNALGNFFVKAVAKSPFHPVLGGGIGIVTVHGRKTGRRYSTPVNISPDGDGFTVVSLRKRTWWRNLRGGGSGELTVSGKQFGIRGEVIEGYDEVVEALLAYFKKNPGYAKYFGVRLDPKGEPAVEDLEQAAEERVVVRLRRKTAA